LAIRVAVRRELRQPSVPSHVLALAAVLEIIGSPGVSLAVEHELTRAANPAAGKLQWENPHAWRKREGRLERRPAVAWSAGRDRTRQAARTAFPVDATGSGRLTRPLKAGRSARRR